MPPTPYPSPERRKDGKELSRIELHCADEKELEEDSEHDSDSGRGVQDLELQFLRRGGPDPSRPITP